MCIILYAYINVDLYVCVSAYILEKAYVLQKTCKHFYVGFPAGDVGSSLGWEDQLKKEMANHSIIFAGNPVDREA